MLVKKYVRACAGRLHSAVACYGLPLLCVPKPVGMGKHVLLQEVVSTSHDLSGIERFRIARFEIVRFQGCLKH